MPSRSCTASTSAPGAGVRAAVGGTAAGVELSAERHPSLLFTDVQIFVLKERILREPYATRWQTVSARAESAPTSFSEERSKARYAKSLAFAYLMTDDAPLAERADVGRRVPVHDDEGMASCSRRSPT